MPWQVRSRCEHGWDERDQKRADGILTAAPLVGQAAWLLSNPPQLMAWMISEDAARALAEALTVVPHIGTPSVVWTPDEEPGEGPGSARPAVKNLQSDTD